MRRSELNRRLTKAALKRRELEKHAAAVTPKNSEAGRLFHGRGILLKKCTHIRSFIEGGLHAYDLLLSEQKTRKISE